MKEIVCVFSESYTNEDLWLDGETDQFSIRQYHYGVIDDEEHYDGEFSVDTFAALQKMIRYNKLRSVLHYYKKLNVEHDLDAVLSSMKQSSTIYNYELMSDRHLKYYEITVDEYAIYYEKTFFSVNNRNKGAVDFAVVRRIWENKEAVTYCEYDYSKNTWVRSAL